MGEIPLIDKKHYNEISEILRNEIRQKNENNAKLVKKNVKFTSIASDTIDLQFIDENETEEHVIFNWPQFQRFRI